MNVLFLSKDLIFSSRVSACARELGIELSIVSEADQCLARASSGQAPLVLLDLSTPSLESGQLVPQLRRLVHPPQAIVAFGPHVHEAKLAAARDAGCDEVLARGQFNSRMGEILTRHKVRDDRTGERTEASISPEQA